MQPSPAQRIVVATLLLTCTLFVTARAQDYGPPSREARGTLLQWSYGTSFSGGPDLAEPLVTDRPDFTEASSTVGREVVQLETGYTYSYDNDGAITKSHSYPEALLRVGALAEWFELRMGWTYGSTAVDTLRREGAEDMYLGIKLGLTPQEGILPEMAIVPQATVPTGGSSFTNDEVHPGVNWLYGWDVTECLATGGSTQVNRSLDEVTGEAYSEWAQSFTVNYSLATYATTYAEWFAFFPHSSETHSTEHYLNGGAALLITADVQWDFRVGLGLNDAADDYFVGTGLSLRFR